MTRRTTARRATRGEGANGKLPVAGCRLSTELAFYGCDMTPDAFNDLLIEMLHNMAPSLGPEQMTYYPIAFGAPYVHAIRARAGKGLPEEMIIRRLRNLQKNPG